MFSRCEDGGGGDDGDVAGAGSGSNIVNVYRTNSFNPLSLTLTFGQGCKEYSSSLQSP